MEDQALHLVSRVGGDAAKTLPQIVSDLDEIKEIARKGGADTNGVPLGVHPAFVGGLVESEFLSRVKKFITAHCDYEGLREVAVFLATQGATGGTRGTVWHFFSVLIDPSNTAQPLVGPIPLSDKGDFVQSQNGAVELTRGTMRPKGGVGAIQALFASTRQGPLYADGVKDSIMLVKALQGDPLTQALVVQDPTKTPIVTFEGGKPALGTDCVTCHRSTPSLIGLGSYASAVAAGAQTQGDLLNSSVGDELPLLSKPSFSPPPGVTSFAAHATLSEDVDYSFRNFGWVTVQGKNRVQISRYTVNESKLVAHQFNSVVLPGRRPPLVLADACVSGPKKAELERCMYLDGVPTCYVKHGCR